ncbi:uncharacterized protein LOC131623035 [Vicia villosa]|uniref:uncharacterized protein LOC131623035 n=1 Tax=Vicia villosa TaxID=3911 RepID=UPI00273AB2D4|nr:uncharacterized protein LOC131623035 [Vicia villosa]
MNPTMGSLNNNSIDTVNAAATAIVTAESRVQPTTTPKKRWGSCFSLPSCFGSQKPSKRIGHAVLVPEPVAPTVPVANAAPNPSTTIVMPFIAPPSSPASFLQSDPPSSTHSPAAGLLSLSSLSVNAYSTSGPATIFTIGPYAYETQLVSPPVFSNFTTEPSTASFTPPPESVQMTTPSSPEVPFAQLLASSLDRARKSNGTHKFALYNYEFQPYQQYPGSPGAQLVSPGSVISTSGTSTPLPDRRSSLEFNRGEAPKMLGFEYFSNRRWGSRMGSGSLTPDGAGQGSRLGSGSLTPDGVSHASRLGSGCTTPDGLGKDSRLGSGSLTPDGAGPTTRDSIHVQNQIPEGVSVANSEHGPQSNATIVDHRVSFELTGEDVARCLANKTGALLRNMSSSSQGILAKDPIDREKILKETNSCCDACSGRTIGGEQCCCQKRNSVSSSSSKEFNFDNRKGDASGTSTNGSTWWTNKKVDGKEGRSVNSWAFFPMLQPDIS